LIAVANLFVLQKNSNTLVRIQACIQNTSTLNVRIMSMCLRCY